MGKANDCIFQSEKKIKIIENWMNFSTLIKVNLLLSKSWPILLTAVSNAYCDNSVPKTWPSPSKILSKAISIPTPRPNPISNID